MIQPHNWCTQQCRILIFARQAEESKILFYSWTFWWWSGFVHNFLFYCSDRQSHAVWCWRINVVKVKRSTWKLGMVGMCILIILVIWIFNLFQFFLFSFFKSLRNYPLWVLWSDPHINSHHHLIIYVGLYLANSLGERTSLRQTRPRYLQKACLPMIQPFPD